jgi:hypothetical protein
MVNGTGSFLKLGGFTNIINGFHEYCPEAKTPLHLLIAPRSELFYYWDYMSSLTSFRVALGCFLLFGSIVFIANNFDETLMARWDSIETWWRSLSKSQAGLADWSVPPEMRLEVLQRLFDSGVYMILLGFTAFYVLEYSLTIALLQTGWHAYTNHFPYQSQALRAGGRSLLSFIY